MAHSCATVSVCVLSKTLFLHGLVLHTHTLFFGGSLTYAYIHSARIFVYLLFSCVCVFFFSITKGHGYNLVNVLFQIINKHTQKKPIEMNAMCVVWRVGFPYEWHITETVICSVNRVSQHTAIQYGWLLLFVVVDLVRLLLSIYIRRNTTASNGNASFEIRVTSYIHSDTSYELLSKLDGQQQAD